MRVEEDRRRAEREGDPAGVLKARLRAGEVEEVSLVVLAGLGHVDSLKVLGLENDEKIKRAERVRLWARVARLPEELAHLGAPTIYCDCEAGDQARGRSTSMQDFLPCAHCDRSGVLAVQPGRWWSAVLAERCARECLELWRREEPPAVTLPGSGSRRAPRASIAPRWGGSMSDATHALEVLRHWIARIDKASLGWLASDAMDRDLPPWVMGALVVAMGSLVELPHVLLLCASALRGRYRGALAQPTRCPCVALGPIEGRRGAYAGFSSPDPDCECVLEGERVVVAYCRDELERRLLG